MNYDVGYQTVDPAMASGDSAALAAVALGVFGVILLFVLAFYVYVAFSLVKIAKKTNTEDAWFAWIPILNIVLMLNIAKKPMWWLLLFFVPGVNLIFGILVWMEIAKAVGKPEWWGILTIVPFVGLVVPGYLAFSNGEVANPMQNENVASEGADNQQPQQPIEQKQEQVEKSGAENVPEESEGDDESDSEE